MSLIFQDENGSGRYFSSKRGWLRPAGEWWKKMVLEFQWTVPCSHCGWSMTLGGGDDGRDLSFVLAVPFLITLYLTVERFFPRRLFKWEIDRGEDRETGLYFADSAVWWKVWVGTMASWSRDYSWCRWWRQGNFRFASVLGKERCHTELLRSDIPVQIHMPEGTYHGLAKVECGTWKRPLWFPRVRVSTWIDVKGGIPFSGKGENSWDCGDCGICGCGVNGDDLAGAVANYRESVLKNRKRHGEPSPAAIVQALAAA